MTLFRPPKKAREKKEGQDARSAPPKTLQLTRTARSKQGKNAPEEEKASTNSRSTGWGRKGRGIPERRERVKAITGWEEEGWRDIVDERRKGSNCWSVRWRSWWHGVKKEGK